MKTKRRRKHRRDKTAYAFASQAGRHTHLTDALAKEISDRIANECSFRDACLLSGVAHDTGFQWLEKGRAAQPAVGADPELYVRFARLVAHAVARRRTALKKMIRRSAAGSKKKPGDWRAAQALGAITDPKEFVPQLRVHISTEFDAALDRLKATFADRPAILEEAYRSLGAVSASEEAEGEEET